MQKGTDLSAFTEDERDAITALALARNEKPARGGLPCLSQEAPQQNTRARNSASSFI
jgi:hypothetical protein